MLLKRFEKAVLFTFFLFVLNSLTAQLSKKHYLPPIFGFNESAIRNIGSSSLYLSTPLDTVFTVSIYHGSSTTPSEQVKVSAKKSAKVLLGEFDKSPIVAKGENYINKAISDKGIRLEANLPFFANIRCKAGAQCISLTSKGVTALGNDFRTGHMVTGLFKPLSKNSSKEEVKGRETYGNFVSIMATANSTEIKLSDFKKGVYFKGLKKTGKNPKQYTTIDQTVTLNKYESLIIYEAASDFNFEDENKSFGSRIQSTKPVAVNIGTALGLSPLGRANDNGADQIVPSEKVGSEYILIKGEGTDILEKVVIVATENGTNFKINNSPLVNVLQAGNHYIIPGEMFTKEKNMHIKANKKVYVYQTLAGSESPATVGLSFIPPLNSCATSNRVTISDIHALGNESTINILTKKGAEVKVFNSDNGKIVEAIFLTKTNLPDNWVTKKYLVPKTLLNATIESEDALTVSMTNRSGGYGASSYYSGFTPMPIIKPLGGVISFLKNNKVTLKIDQSEDYNNFKWFKNGKFYKESRSKSIIINEIGTYYVVGINNQCNKEVKSNEIKIELPVVVNEVEEVFVEKPENELEEIILDKTIDPSLLVNINYKSNSVEVVDKSILVLKNIVTTLKKFKNVKIEVRAHTDCKGSEEYNLKLSQGRAEYVKNYMVKNGISSDRIIPIGLGETEPLPITKCACEECSDAIMAMNRRSEFKIIR